jgi:hypothetical protein
MSAFDGHVSYPGLWRIFPVSLERMEHQYHRKEVKTVAFLAFLTLIGLALWATGHLILR